MSDALFVLATMYRVVYTVGGGYLTARLAPERPMRHVIVLGCVGLVAATIGLVATWNSGPELGPKWYPILLVVTALPCVWLGGRVFNRAYTIRSGRLQPAGEHPPEGGRYG
jgi:hypothetical protein